MDDYITKNMKIINSLPDEHFIHTIVVTNGMKFDLAKHPKLHIAMMELLSSGFTVKMNGKGTGTFIAKQGKFELVLIHGDKNIVCVVFINNKQIFEFNADKTCFYDFSYDKGRLYYNGMTLATFTKHYQYVDQENIKKLAGGKKK